jgi:GNAT superfamily N-acetyltransferase
LISIRPLTADLWPAFEALFGKAGASNGCWCMYWRLGADYHKRDRALNKRDFRRLVKKGPPPGLLAFEGEKAIGWCQITPRQELHWLTKSRKPIDAKPIWAISCFYIHRDYRKQKVSEKLIDAAVAFARKAKAPAVEAYPIDTGAPKTTHNLYTGVAKSFARAGFVEIARPQPHRPSMRLKL